MVVAPIYILTNNAHIFSFLYILAHTCCNFSFLL